MRREVERRSCTPSVWLLPMECFRSPPFFSVVNLRGKRFTLMRWIIDFITSRCSEVRAKSPFNRLCLAWFQFHFRSGRRHSRCTQEFTIILSLGDLEGDIPSISWGLLDLVCYPFDAGNFRFVSNGCVDWHCLRATDQIEWRANVREDPRTHIHPLSVPFKNGSMCQELFQKHIDEMIKWTLLNRAHSISPTVLALLFDVSHACLIIFILETILKRKTNKHRGREREKREERTQGKVFSRSRSLVLFLLLRRSLSVLLDDKSSRTISIHFYSREILLSFMSIFSSSSSTPSLTDLNEQTCTWTSFSFPKGFSRWIPSYSS